MVRRRGSFRPPVLAALLLLLAGACTAAPDPLPPLLDRLGDKSFQERERADREIRALAPGRLRALAEAREKAEDLEVQSRLDAVLSCPRLVFADALVREGPEAVRGEHWFRVEHEELPVGYRRLEILEHEVVFETEGRIQGDYALQRVRYELSENLVPRALQASLYPVWGQGLFKIEGALGPEGWTLKGKGKEETKDRRVAWTDRDFPLEMALAFLPLWARKGPLGREVVLRSLDLGPEFTKKGNILRDEGDRVTLRLEGEDKPFLTVFLGPDGRILSMVGSDNLRAVRITPEEGKRLRESYAKDRAAIIPPP